jgi:hypothetical protein
MTNFEPLPDRTSDYARGRRQGAFEGFWVGAGIVGFLWLAWVCLPYAGGQ